LIRTELGNIWRFGSRYGLCKVRGRKVTDGLLLRYGLCSPPRQCNILKPYTSDSHLQPKRTTMCRSHSCSFLRPFVSGVIKT